MQATANDLKRASDELERVWVERKTSVERAQKREAKAKAAFFTAYEQYVLARQREEAK